MSPSPSSPSQTSSSGPEVYYYGNIRFGLRALVIGFHEGLFYIGEARHQRQFLAAMSGDDLLDFIRAESLRLPEGVKAPPALPDLDISL